MTHALVFGYGSLVNRETHAYTETHRAVARGWRRAWRRTTIRPVSFLTVIPDTGSEIDGLVAGVPAEAWTALDERERAYARVDLVDVAHAAGVDRRTAIYAIHDGDHDAPGRENPVLLSYVDTVVSGYLREFGEEGAWRFAATTDGWHAPVMDDRTAPLYARAGRMERSERALVDAILREVGADVFRPAD